MSRPMSTRRIGVLLASFAMSLFGVIAAAPGATAGASSTYQSQHAGGTLKLLASTAGGTLDPQVNYTLQYWQLYQATYDGLVSLPEGGRSRVRSRWCRTSPSRMPTITNGGKTYTFTLRKGIKFSNGKPVTVNDVLASFQRIFKVSNPNAGSWYNVIVGGAGLPRHAGDVHVEGRGRGERLGQHGHGQPAHSRRGVPRPAGRTLRFHPAGHCPAKDSGTTPIPGTGAYMFKSYDPNHRPRDGAQPLLQGLVGGRPAPGLPERDRHELRHDGRVRGHGGGERPGRLGLRRASLGPAPAAVDEVRRASSTSTR